MSRTISVYLSKENYEKIERLPFKSLIVDALLEYLFENITPEELILSYKNKKKFRQEVIERLRKINGQSYPATDTVKTATVTNQQTESTVKPEKAEKKTSRYNDLL